MAQKRMFDKRIIESDKFIDMPMSAKALYFLLGMYADDRGFVSPRYVMRMHGSNDDDLKLLVMKQYLIYFESGVVVITDWNKNNWLDKRRIQETEFLDEYKSLKIIEEKYCLANAKPMLRENRIEENRIEQNSIEENNKKETHKKNNFTKPTIDEIESYCKERNNNVNANRFYDFYESKGWMVGRNKMKDWKACVRTWEARQKKDKPQKETTIPQWFGKEIEKEKLTKQEQEAMKEMLKEFKEE